MVTTEDKLKHMVKVESLLWVIVKILLKIDEKELLLLQKNFDKEVEKEYKKIKEEVGE